MNATETKTVKVVPKKYRSVTDVEKKRIFEEKTLDLNKKEIYRCMQTANVYEGDTLLNGTNYNKDLSTLPKPPKPSGPSGEDSDKVIEFDAKNDENNPVVDSEENK